jgi:hypothetical protein
MNVLAPVPLPKCTVGVVVNEIVAKVLRKS